MSSTRLIGTFALLVVFGAVLSCGGSEPGAEPTAAVAADPVPIAVTPAAVPPTAVPPPAAQATATPEPLAQLFPYTVVDSTGSEVTFERPPERIVAYDSAAVETLFEIGEAHRVVATHSFVTYPPETADIPKVGGAFDANIEEIVALEPDLVFIFFDAFLEDLERAGLKVLYLQTLNNEFEKTADIIRMWGRIVGNVDAAELAAARFETEVASVKETVGSVEGSLRVFQDVGGLWTPGPDTLVGEVFSLLKLENIAHDISGYAQLSPEVIVARDPQVIFAAEPESITGNPAFKGVSAVREGRIVVMPDALSIAGPRFARGIQELAALVYPELFSPPASADDVYP